MSRPLPNVPFSQIAPWCEFYSDLVPGWMLTKIGDRQDEKGNGWAACSVDAREWFPFGSPVRPRREVDVK